MYSSPFIRELQSPIFLSSSHLFAKLGCSLKEHERNWSEEPKLRSELEALRSDLEQYANALAVIVGVSSKNNK
jgi:hypothetical protein